MSLQRRGLFVWLLAATAAAWLLAACAAGPRGGAAPRVALVIGNAAYENAPVLVNPANDAADMCAALRRLGFRTLCHQNLRNRAEFEARVAEYLALLTPGAVGVVHYSGHGVQAGNANYLIPTQAQPDEALAQPLRVLYGIDELFERLRGRPTRFQLIILDACRNDLFDDGTPRPDRPAGARVAGNTAATAAATPSRGTAGAAGTSGTSGASGTAGAAGTSAASGSRTRLLRALESQSRAATGLAPIKDAPPATIVLYATGAREAAFDGEGRNGPLTRHVLEHIGTRGQPVEEFIKRVTAGVEAETLRDYRKRQTPYIYGSFTGRFCFAGCPGEADVPPAF
ncbi:MAG: caspase family protein [Rubrivivax sp.]|nr:caspase family protein [Rubrivivax sp.]